MQTNKVFVYGTLRRGCSNYDIMGKPRFLGQAVTPGTLYFGPGFPYGIFDADGPDVIGELYEVDEPTLHQLDRLEGHDDLPAKSFYHRTLVPVSVDGNWTEAWAYDTQIPPEHIPGLRPIPGNDYVTSKRRKFNSKEEALNF